MHRFTFRHICALSVLLLAGAAWPQGSTTDQLNSRIEALEKSLSEHSSGASGNSSATGVPLHGFIDVGYASSDGKHPAHDRPGFRLGTLDIYLTPQFGDRIKALVEIAFEYGHDHGFATDLERLQLGYVWSNSATLWAGRFHTPYGYWNTGFHHGAQIQTSITRPRFIAFEDHGGILPAHKVGLWVTGKFGTSAGQVLYDAYVANAGSLRDGKLDFNASGHDAAAPASGFKLGLSPSVLPDLVFGLHALNETVHSYDSNKSLNGKVQFQVAGAYAFYESDDWEVLAEYYSFKNLDVYGNAGTNQSSAWFLQVGRTVAERLTAYARYEKADLNSADPYFQRMNNGTTHFGSSYHQSTVGLRYELTPQAALKLQFEQIVDEGSSNQPVNWVRGQYAVRF